MKKLIVLFQVAFFFLTLSDVYSQWYRQISGTTQLLKGVSLINANTGTVVGWHGTILRTTNGGTNWNPQSGGTYNINLLDVFFTNENNGTAVSNFHRIYRTTNGGINWISQTTPAYMLFGITFTDVNNGFAVGRDGRILRTTNGGISWYSQTSGTTSDLDDVSFADAQTGFVVGGDSTAGRILRTTNGGINWVDQTSGPIYFLFGVSFTNANTGTVVGYGGKILRTTNGGTNWTAQTSGTTEILFGVSFTDANTGTVVGEGGTILRTTNGGTNWTPQTSGTTLQLFDVFFTDANTGTIVGNAGIILRTTNGGVTTIPTAPVLISPVNGATLLQLNPLLDWDSSLFLENYRIQVSTDSLFTSTVYDSSGIIITEFQIPNNGLNINTTYYWRVNATNVAGTSPWSIIFHFKTGATNISGNNEIPKEFRLYNSYPNPFNPTTNIKFDIPKTSDVKLIVYNILGKEITMLINEKLNAGSYEVDWPAPTGDGSSYPSGVYFYKLTANKFSEVKKMVLVK